MVHVVPIRPSVVSDIEPAVNADDHVPAVFRVEPQGVTVGVHPAAEVAAEGPAPVRRTVLLNTQRVDELVILRVHADDAEVHRPWVEAVDAGPRLAAVRGLVNTAVLEAVGALLILDVLALACIVSRERPGA